MRAPAEEVRARGVVDPWVSLEHLVQLSKETGDRGT